MHTNLDPDLVTKVVQEVKSHGVFDQFRRGCMSDVDTKPAYQNLRQRVENAVGKFLSQQKFKPEMNKNQLREKLRKHITEAGFLDVGVERIVDQVVNPKIATVFQPEIETIAYRYLGIEKPKPKIEEKPKIPSLLSLNLNGGGGGGYCLDIKTDLMMHDLEQVSPDSDKATVKSDSKDDFAMDDDEKLDDFESPAFEPIEPAGGAMYDIVKKEEIPDEHDGTHPTNNHNSESNSQISGISGLTSQSSEKNHESPNKSHEELNNSGEMTQESVLSQVSSNSRLSIVTSETEENNSNNNFGVKEENNVNISEEAQMPKFSENSNSNMEKHSEPLHFDIKKDEIIFEGTDRNAEKRVLESPPPAEKIQPENGSKMCLTIEKPDEPMERDLPTPVPTQLSYENFNFSKININPPIFQTTDSKTLEDSVDKELKIIETSMTSSSQPTKPDIPEPPSVDLMKSPKTVTSEESKKESPTSSNKSSHSGKDRNPTPTSSSHKKHSKDKKSDRDRDRSSGSSSHRKHTSSDPKRHSSENGKAHQTSRQSSHSSSRSQSSTSSKDVKDTRGASSSHRSKYSSRDRDGDRKHERSSSEQHKSRSDREKSDKSRNKSSGGGDDHYSSKHKSQRRKSTDSNDGESSRDTSKNGPSYKQGRSYQQTAAGGNSTHNSTVSPNSSVSDSADTHETHTAPNKYPEEAGEQIVLTTKPIILDGLLDNPNTKFIQLGGSGIQQVCSTVSPPVKLPEEDLLYFEEDSESTRRIQFALVAITREIQKIQRNKNAGPSATQTGNMSGNSCASGTESNSSDCSSDSKGCCVLRNLKRKHTGSSVSSSDSDPPQVLQATSATLTIDCIQYDGIASLSKKFKFTSDPSTKVSPTPSEMSAGSKENDSLEKNSNQDVSVVGKIVKKSEKRSSINKTASQRYASEDLYKPRPVLSQRSRRRGLDADVL